MSSTNQSSNSQSNSSAGSQGNSSAKASIKVDLSSSVEELLSGNKAVLTFSFSSMPIDFSLSDIKVTNGVVTNLVQSLSSPNTYTADFIGGVTDISGMSTIKLNGSYYDSSWIDGTPSNTITIKNLPTTTMVPFPTVGFTSNNASVTEGNSGTTDINFTVQLSKSSTEFITVNYTTEQKTFGTAKANLDYIPVTSTVVFAPGETSKTVTVKVVGDTICEGTESFYVDLTSATGASIVINGAEGYRNNWAVGNINNDDVSATPTVGFTSNNISVVEGNSGFTSANFTVQLSKSSTECVF